MAGAPGLDPECAVRSQAAAIADAADDASTGAQVHVWGAPECAPAWASLCTLDREARIVFHQRFEKVGDEFACLDCGETTTEEA